MTNKEVGASFGQKWVSRNPYVLRQEGLAGFMMEYLPEIGAVMIAGTQAANEGFLVMAKEAVWQEVKSRGAGQVKRWLISELETIDNDPYGKNSLDPDAESTAAQKIRRVNKMGERWLEITGYPVAVKSFGSRLLYKYPQENLVTQFSWMSYLGQQNEKLEDLVLRRVGRQLLIRFDRVAGVIRRKDGQQYLFMEAVEGERINLFCEKEEDLYRPTIFRKDHPQLVDYVYPGEKRNKINWKDLENRMENDIEIELGDLKPRNFLEVRKEDGKREYVIIDQMPRGMRGGW